MSPDMEVVSEAKLVDYVTLAGNENGTPTVGVP
jgi:hypothetical protein